MAVERAAPRHLLKMSRRDSPMYDREWLLYWIFALSREFWMASSSTREVYLLSAV